MKITDVKVYKAFGGWRNWLFVKIETDAGLHGWGEGTLEGKELAVEGAVHDAARYLDGQDPRRVVSLVRSMQRDPFWQGGVVLNTAISALEIALWDIAGKALEVPVWRLLGGEVRRSVRAYANGWYFGARTLDDFAERAARMAAQGYTALKWDPFGRADGAISPDELQFALACVGRVRAAVGPDVELLIEGHGRFRPAVAVKIARLLAPHDITFFEEPVPPGNHQLLREVAKGSPLPIAAGERVYGLSSFRELLELQALAVVQPDVTHAGGIQETLQIAALAESWQVAVAPHNPNGPVATAATLQLAALAPNFDRLEYLANDAPWRAQIARCSWQVEGGEAGIPTGPGLGVEVDVAALAAYPYRPCDLNFFSAKSVLEAEVGDRPGEAAS